MMSLSNQEKIRYSRHILLDSVGEAGQEKLKQAKVLVIGAGGLGCPVLQYIVAAGVGVVGVIDFDVVDETNLQRQVLFTVDDVGMNKATTVKTRLEKLNPLIQINAYPEKLTTQNVLNLFSEYDIIVDGTDNFSTRYLVNDACVITNKPLVYGAIYKFEGQVTVFNYQNGPSYRCLFPNPPQAGSVPNCSEIGVIGVLPGIIGAQQANEVIKMILGIGATLSGKLLMYDALNATNMTLNIVRSESEINKAIELKDNFINMDYELFCGVKKTTGYQDVSAEELKQLMENEELQIIDVREDWEEPKYEELKAINIPLSNIPVMLDQLDCDKKTVVFCQHGIRSLACIDFLQKNDFNNLVNLKGGIVTW